MVGEVEGGGVSAANGRERCALSTRPSTICALTNPDQMSTNLMATLSGAYSSPSMNVGNVWVGARGLTPVATINTAVLDSTTPSLSGSNDQPKQFSGIRTASGDVFSTPLGLGNSFRDAHVLQEHVHIRMALVISFVNVS